MAKDFVGEVSFAVSSKNDLKMEMDQFGLDSGLEVAVGLFNSKGQKYSMQEKFK